MNRPVLCQASVRAASMLLLLCVAVLPAFAFDADLARTKSTALTAAQMQRAWDLFEGGFEKAKAGNVRAATDLFRAGLKIHPAELRTHAILASLLEQQGRDREALEHWQAVRALGADEPDDQARANASVQRINARLGRPNDMPALQSSQASRGNVAPAPEAGVEQERAQAETRRRQEERDRAEAEARRFTDEIRRKADSGDVAAMKNLADLHAKGERLPRDEAQALAWLIRAGEKGDAAAQVRVGRMYATGQGVVAHKQEAFRWFAMAAAQGDVAGLTYEAKAYLDGLGVGEDRSRAIKTLLAISEKGGDGSAPAMAQLAKTLEHDKKYPEALLWYQKAADAGDPAGMAGLGFLLGWGVAQDPAKAEPLLHKAANAGSKRAMSLLGTMYRVGEGVKKDPAKALHWIMKGIESGDLRQTNILADLLLAANSPPKDLAHARELLRQGEAAGDSGSMFSLGAMLEQGLGVPPNDTAAFAMYSKAAALGNGWAMFKLGLFYKDGRGGVHDLATATSWFQKSTPAVVLLQAKHSREFRLLD